MKRVPHDARDHSTGRLLPDTTTSCHYHHPIGLTPHSKTCLSHSTCLTSVLNDPLERRVASKSALVAHHEPPAHCALGVSFPSRAHELLRGANLAPSKSDGISHESIPKSAMRVLQAAQIRAEHAKRKRENPDEDDGRSGKRRKQDGAAGKAKAKAKDNAEGNGKGEMKILPGESLAHFNRCVPLGHVLFIVILTSSSRVEDGMRGDVRAAMQSSSAHGRKARKQETETAAATKAANIAKNAAKSHKRHASADSDSEGEISTKPVDKHADRPKEFTKIQTSAPRNVNDIALAPPTLSLKKATKLQALAGPEGLRGGKAAGVLSMAQRAMMEVEREKAIKHYRELKEKRFAQTQAQRGSVG